MRRRSDLFDYQSEAAERMRTARQLACFLEPGMGKTAITLTALHDLGRPTTLVLAPARVAETVWHAEAARWEHLAGFRVVPLVGSPDRRTALLMGGRWDVIVLSYENLAWLLDTVDLPATVSAIVFDELSKMKHPGSTRFRRLRRCIHRIDTRIGLTGTPVGNHLLDLWGEMYMVAGAKPLGPTFGEFQVRYFQPTAKVNNIAVGWKPFPTAQREIEARIKPFAFTLKPTTARPLPELRVNVIEVPLPDYVQEASRQLARDLTTQLDSGTDLFAFSSTTAAMKIRQMTGGAVYTNGEDWEHVHGAKLQAMEDLVGELQGQPALVFYWFKHEAERLLAHFQGRARTLSSPKDIDAWNRGEVELLLLHPASAGHGLNLQHGGHTCIWFTLPWSLEMWKQSLGRIRRTGQRSPYVMAHVLEAGPTDARVLNVLHRKGTVEDELLAAMLD
jgi:SNF2 family DNA or RNA helicase